MTVRVLTILAVALAVVLGAPLLPFLFAAAAAVAVVLAWRIDQVTMRTGWRTVPVRSAVLA